METKPKLPRGFAAMTLESRRKIASLGGKSVAPEKRSFSRFPELAAEAGSKGGLAVPAENRVFAKDRQLAARAGAAGGKTRPTVKS